MKSKLEHRRVTKEQSEARKEITIQRLDPMLMKIAKYFAEKTGMSAYNAGKWLLCMSVYSIDNIMQFHPTYWHGCNVTIGKALRMIIYYFIKNDIDKKIIVERSRLEYVDVFNDKAVINYKRGVYKFNPYGGWRIEWIESLLRTAIKFEDEDVVRKILNRIDANERMKIIKHLISTKKTAESKSVLMRYISNNFEDKLEL
jgi:hypothetical protein